jgi:FKBP-type peptidyl-prolyl cis-trans isomerase
MKRWIAILCMVVLSAATIAEEATAPKTPKEKVSYAIGISMGTQLKDIIEDIDLNVLFGAVKDVTGGKPKMTDAEMREVMQGFMKEMQSKMGDKAKKAGEKNVKDGEAFLAENGKKEGVKTTASGLQYKVIKEGDGEMPKLTDTVTTHYEGKLLDGTVFDSSIERKEPVSFPVKGVIPGWTEALQLMKVGSKYQLFIPSKLAYGENGAPPKIGPNSTLIFDVELLSIKK